MITYVSEIITHVTKFAKRRKCLVRPTPLQVACSSPQFTTSYRKLKTRILWTTLPRVATRFPHGNFCTANNSQTQKRRAERA